MSNTSNTNIPAGAGNNSAKSTSHGADDTSSPDISNFASPVITPDDYEKATGEKLSQTLDLSRWDSSNLLTEAMERLAREMEEASRTEKEIVRQIRQQVYEALRNRPNRPKQAGVYEATLDQIRNTQNTTLFNGLAEACDANSHVFNTLPVQIIQVGVGLVSYQGKDSTWAQRIYRRDVRISTGKNIAEDIVDILHKRAGGDGAKPRAKVTDMLRRAITTIAERSVLVEKSEAPWRMGHGNPLAHEILTGSGMIDIIEIGIPLLHKLVTEVKRFVFVTSDTDKDHYITIGNALMPGQYAIIDNMSDELSRTFRGGYRGEWGKWKDRLKEFEKEIGPNVLAGVYRSSSLGPPHLFYAHAEHVHEAALIAMADSILQEHRNFPMLIDIADGLCRTLFGANTLNRPAEVKLAEMEEPFQYLSERGTRNK